MSGDPLLWNLQLAVHFIECHQTLFRFHYHNVFVCHSRTGLSGWLEEWVHMQSLWEERNAYRCLFLCDFFELYIDTNVHLQPNISAHPSWCNNLQQAKHYWCLNHWVRCWVWHVPSWVEMCLAEWLQEETLKNETSCNLYYNTYKQKFQLPYSCTVTLEMDVEMYVGLHLQCHVCSIIYNQPKVQQFDNFPWMSPISISTKTHIVGLKLLCVCTKNCDSTSVRRGEGGGHNITLRYWHILCEIK